MRRAFLIHGLVVLIASLLSLFLLLPSLAVGVRRLHDLDKSGWWLLLAMIPLVGTVVLIIWYCLPGTPGPNRFGGASFVPGGPMPMPVGYN